VHIIKYTSTKAAHIRALPFSFLHLSSSFLSLLMLSLFLLFMSPKHVGTTSLGYICHSSDCLGSRGRLSAAGRPRLEGHEFKASLGHIVRPSLKKEKRRGGREEGEGGAWGGRGGKEEDWVCPPGMWCPGIRSPCCTRESTLWEVAEQF
jgi:hypothetical protein